MVSANQDDIDVRALRVFLAVVDHGGMTAAAGEAGMTQSAVSQAVARLEKAMGVALIERGRRPLAATPAGSVLAERARRVLTDIEGLAETVRDAEAGARPRVRLGLIDSVAGTIGAALIRAIRSEVREVSVWSGISPNLRRDLDAGRLDLVVTTDPAMLSSGRSRRLLREPFVAVVPSRMRGASVPIDPMALSERLPLVRYSVRSVIGEDIERALARRGRVPPRVFEFDGSDGVFAMVSAGLGWAVTTPLCLVHGRMFGPDIRAVPLAGPLITRDIHLMAANAVGAGLQAKVRSAALGLLGELLAGEMARLAPATIPHIKIG